MLKNTFYIGGFVVVLLGLSAFMMIRFTLFSSGVPEEGRFQLPGLQEEVELLRRESGRVHITAATATDGFRALGFVHARDRLWQLQRFKWAADSEWAAVFGDAFLPSDRLTTALLHPFHEQPERALEELPAGQRRILESYAAGINAYIAASGQQYPLQFTLIDTPPERWQAADVLRVFVLQLWLFQTQWQQDIAYAAILPQLPDNVLFNLLEADQQLRMHLNAPEQLPAIRTLVSRETGMQLSALQSGTQAFGYWYDVSLHIGGDEEGRQFSGFTLPGAPLFWAGTNEQQPSWTAQHAFESRNLILNSDTAAVHPAVRALKRADGSQTPFNFTSSPAGFSLERAAAGILFRRPGGAGNFSVFFESMMQRGQLGTPAAAPESGPERLANFATGVFPALESTLETAAPEISPAPGDTLVAAIHNTIGQAFGQRQINAGRLALARELAGLIEPYISEPRLQLSYDYLANWDGGYDQYAVAASIIEGSLLETSRRALKPYIEEGDFARLERLGLIGTALGRHLVGAHITARQTGRSSAVDDAFFARRVLATINKLKQDLGDEPYTWRWANHYGFQYGDERLCPEDVFASAPPADSLDTLPGGWFSGRRNGCRQIIMENPHPVSGQKQLINAALGYRTEAGFRVATITTGFLQQADTSVRLMQLPGYAAHPFSRYYGGNIAPGTGVLHIERPPAPADAPAGPALLLHPE
ncbi:MAG: penicillin acylase family protein [Cyclonatronaceae bacterium]